MKRNILYSQMKFRDPLKSDRSQAKQMEYYQQQLIEKEKEVEYLKLQLTKQMDAAKPNQLT